MDDPTLRDPTLRDPTLRDPTLRDLAIRDLTDPAQGPHAIQLILAEILAAVSADPRVERGERVVDVADNYDRLGYAPGAATRDARHTRYVDERRMLRSQTSALVPPALRRLAAQGRTDAVLACPGIVYRRDVIDRLHTGTPHQLDLWRLAPRPLTGEDLRDLIGTALGAAVPGVTIRTVRATHPYTTEGSQIDAYVEGRWVEVGECGLAARHVLAGAGLAGHVHGLALGLGLDRLLMIRKGIDDIRLLRSEDPQMLDLSPYVKAPMMPAARRDVSVALPAGVTAEEIGDRVREVLGPRADLVEEVVVLSETRPAALPAAARERLGITAGEVNVLLRVVLRDPHGTVAGEIANEIRDRVHETLHHAVSNPCNESGGSRLMPRAASQAAAAAG